MALLRGRLSPWSSSEMTCGRLGPDRKSQTSPSANNVFHTGESLESLPPSSTTRYGLDETRVAGGEWSSVVEVMPWTT